MATQFERRLATAVRGAVLSGVTRPCVFVLSAESPVSRQIFQDLRGRPFPAPSGTDPLPFAVGVDSALAALCAHAGPAGEAAARVIKENSSLRVWTLWVYPHLVGVRGGFEKEGGPLVKEEFHLDGTPTGRAT